MERSEVGKQELLEILTRELQAEVGREHRFTHLLVLRGTDPAGCNWSSATLVGPENDSQTKTIAGQIVSRTKARYNVRKQPRSQ